MDNRVFVHLAEGFEEIEALAVVDILRRGEVDVQTVSMTGEKLVKSVRGIGVQCDILFEEADYDRGCMMVLPGGQPGVNNLSAHPGLGDQLKAYQEQGKWIAAICAAPIALHRNGMIGGKTVTCYPGCGDDFAEARVVEESVVVDGRLVTSRGPGTAIEFGLKLLEILKGGDKAREIRAKLLA